MASWPKNILLISFNPRFLAGKTHHISQPMIMRKKVSIRNWATHWACFVVWGMWKEAEREGLKTDRTCFDHLVGICLMFIFSFPELCVWCYNWLLCPEPLRDTSGPGRVYRPTVHSSVEVKICKLYNIKNVWEGSKQTCTKKLKGRALFLNNFCYFETFSTA